MSGRFPNISSGGIPGDGSSARWFIARNNLQRARGLPTRTFFGATEMKRPTMTLSAWDPAEGKMISAVIRADIVMEMYHWNRLEPLLRCQVPRSLLPPVIHQSLGPAYVSEAPQDGPPKQC